MNVLSEITQKWVDKNIEDKCDRVSVFRKINKIFYTLIPGNRLPENALLDLVNKNTGSCEGKHFLLGQVFQATGLEVRYYSYKFFWNKLSCDLPKKLKTLSRDLFPEYHLACKVKINGKWILLDATWDPGLKQTGFFINDIWDGESHTSLAVNAVEEIPHKSISERYLFVSEKRKKYTLQDNKIFLRFANEFNRWIMRARKDQNKGDIV